MSQLPVGLLGFAAVVSGFTALITGGTSITEPFSGVDFSDTGVIGEGILREGWQAFTAVFVVLFNLMTLNVEGMPVFIRFVYGVTVGGAFIWATLPLVLKAAEVAAKFLDSIIPFVVAAGLVLAPVAFAPGVEAQSNSPNGDNTECVGVDFPAVAGVVAAGPASFCVSYPGRVSEVGDSFYLTGQLIAPLLVGTGDLDIDYILEQGCTEASTAMGGNDAILFQQWAEWSRFILTDQTCTLLAAGTVEDAAGNLLWAPLFGVAVIADDVPRDHIVNHTGSVSITDWPAITGAITATLTGNVDVDSQGNFTVAGIEPGAVQADVDVDFVSITDLWWLILFAAAMIYGARREKVIMALGGLLGVINEMLSTPVYARAFFVLIVLIGYWANYIAEKFHDWRQTE